jgi:hypothetical protein
VEVKDESVGANGRRVKAKQHLMRVTPFALGMIPATYLVWKMRDTARWGLSRLSKGGLLPKPASTRLIRDAVWSRINSRSSA